MLRQVQGRFQIPRLEVADHAAPQSLLHRSQKHGLGHNTHIPLVPGQGWVNLLILADHDKSGGIFPRVGQRQLGQGLGPVGQRLNKGQFLGLPHQIVAQRLSIHRGGAQPGAVHQFFQFLPGDGPVLIESPVAAVFSQ